LNIKNLGKFARPDGWFNNTSLPETRVHLAAQAQVAKQSATALRAVHACNDGGRGRGQTKEDEPVAWDARIPTHRFLFEIRERSDATLLQAAIRRMTRPISDGLKVACHRVGRHGAHALAPRMFCAWKLSVASTLLGIDR
jgi:hypothetical protein